jgi:hypothetical protein
MSALGILGNQYQTPEQEGKLDISRDQNAIARERLAADQAQYTSLNQLSAEQIAAQKYMAELQAATAGKGFLGQAYGKAADTAIAGGNMNNVAIGNFLKAIRR